MVINSGEELQQPNLLAHKLLSCPILKGTTPSSKTTEAGPFFFSRYCNRDCWALPFPSFLQFLYNQCWPFGGQDGEPRMALTGCCTLVESWQNLESSFASQGGSTGTGSMGTMHCWSLYPFISNSVPLDFDVFQAAPPVWVSHFSWSL